MRRAMEMTTVVELCRWRVLREVVCVSLFVFVFVFQIMRMVPFRFREQEENRDERVNESFKKDYLSCP